MLNKSIHLLVLFTAVFFTGGGAAETTKEELDKITELNRLIWSWRRCVNRWEHEHGPSKDGRPPPICGPEPKPPAR